ncbi:trans-1,2-dihydrobenzene-1,2-diol dehydrogenase-like [Melanaphis sacchari]|uniref:Trans-1,2-dihydrobenzene-1,2-diol dehydrogenase n=1 Tax=Melanaphis sacchari TaxID=742174 RepID=A0A2H8TJB9_9HEMI|nr:trans-1,2-dihydrobenzene-1,2-diol dehydrogenase-like [Melanaphis sacchari]XP_025207022.1 trans-1,2-dihydrobenzene-1,2-diol dehydrogenase-like [Melanaphis sacchari]
MATKWGILSASKISHDFVLALETLSVEDHKVVAVAAKDKSRAKDFAVDFKIPTYYGSYEELGNDINVDVVYIGALNHQHYSLTKLMLESGKHVLCEKPFCINAKQLDELIKLSKTKQLFLMEAMWSRFTPAYQKVVEEVQNGTIGTVLHVQANFGRQMSNIERIWKKEVGGGSILDIGVYTLHLIDTILGPGKPVSIESKGTLNIHGTDENMSAILEYPEGKIAVISTHTKVVMDCSAYIHGTKGTIKIHEPFHASKEVTVNTTKFTFEQPDTRKPTLFPSSVQLRYEIDHVRHCLKKGLIESPVVTLNNSYTVQEIMDRLRNQIGVHFEDDYNTSS